MSGVCLFALGSPIDRLQSAPRRSSALRLAQQKLFLCSTSTRARPLEPGGAIFVYLLDFFLFITCTVARNKRNGSEHELKNAGKARDARACLLFSESYTFLWHHRRQLLDHHHHLEDTACLLDTMENPHASAALPPYKCVAKKDPDSRCSFARQFGHDRRRGSRYCSNVSQRAYIVSTKLYLNSTDPSSKSTTTIRRSLLLPSCLKL